NKVQPEYAASKTYKYDVDIDLEDQPLQDWFVEHEDDSNVATSVVRIWAEEGSATARPARKADFLWNGNPLDGDANGPIKTTGVLTMVSDGWVVGTFDPTAGIFTLG
ncbi:MAG: hypothetical protein LBI64_00655, partial [Coriobacteriales bacterium]|nr:hypothetical protein [Coriobacteriales bacterium]